MIDTTQYADSFALIDTNGDGLISAAELVRLMQALGDEVTDEAAGQAVALMDDDGDGLISLPEFAGFLESRRASGPASAR
ncbi:MAG TPA: EF-hand domain-containing protein [Mycobacteriales bacterium]|jgi:Ca2+-binding EF-hand superfamily protein|nr:EF-hand domain-containing protein [Mycobacteriales bacterium]